MHHWIADTLKHGYRPQHFVSICPRNRVMAKYWYVIFASCGRGENGSHIGFQNGEQR
jgi:hypothetical protein